MDEQLQVQRIVLAYVRTDGRMHGQLQWKAFVQWIASVYIRTDRLTAIDQSYVRQARFGSQDAAIWGGELKDNLDKKQWIWFNV